ncbi:plasmid mobilization relaxosome protein MobC [Magnetovibrio sp. PR-2]|uniref:plasmid mobilization protein n=1 Tax=Magnetovibrio sp. PR-2 TaxID=3120356 RepID=UPI002FCDEEEE
MNPKSPSKKREKKPDYRERIWSVRYSARENEELEKLAESAGFNSTSTYIRNASLKRLFSRTDAKTIRQLMLLGNNLNQLTRRAHNEGLQELEERIFCVLDELSVAVKQIGHTDDRKKNSEA